VKAEPGVERRQYVEPELSEARVARLWAGVSRRLEHDTGAKRFWPRFAVLGPMAVAACLTTLYFMGALPWGAPRGPELQAASLTTQGDALSMTLHDGSELQVGPRSRVELAEVREKQVVVKLAEGHVTCDVIPNRQRVFAVHAGGVEVRVLGTRFSVERSTKQQLARVEVRVDRGRVEVRRQDGSSPPRLLMAGESWVFEERPGDTVALEGGDSEFDAPVAAGDPARDAQGPEQLAAEAADPVAGRPNAAPRPQTPPGERARELLQKATEARRAGRFAEAARAYQELASAHGQDSRAGLAAFELGRLRMDHLGDDAGAASALQQALASSGAAAFREDALARLARAHARLGQTSQCAKARQQYLDLHPHGVHVKQVLGLCPP
jgi:TolA-binding protein